MVRFSAISKNALLSASSPQVLSVVLESALRAADADAGEPFRADRREADTGAATEDAAAVGAVDALVGVDSADAAPADSGTAPSSNDAGAAAASAVFGPASASAADNAAAAAVAPAAGPAAAAGYTAPAGDTPAYLLNTAAVTMASGDESAKGAVVWAQTMRDVGTQIPNLLVMLCRGGIGSPDCLNTSWRAERGRENVGCGDAATTADEIVSQRYLDALTRLGVQYKVIDPLPETPYTAGIPGGRVWFWGMAFNKLRIFDPAVMPYRKLLWSDSDTFIMRNIDHLLHHPMFFAAFTVACCNGNSPAQPSGGLWVVEPNAGTKAEIDVLMNNPVPGTENDYWHWGDMQVVRYLFGKPPPPNTEQPLWPAIEDGRHGYIEGLEHLPVTADLTPQELQDSVFARMHEARRAGPGFLNGSWDGVHPKYVWHSLSVLYDQCVRTFT